MEAWGVAIIVILVLLVVGVVGWILFSRWRAQRLGLPPPSLSSFIPFRGSGSSSGYGIQPAPGGVVGWFRGQVAKFRNRNNRTATGAYEGSSGAQSRGHRGFGPLDPDEAWDTRVGNEADTYGPGGFYEEQELGLHPPRGGAGARSNLGADTEYGGSSYQMNLAATPGAAPAGYVEHERGRSQTREQGLHPGGHAGRNPFEDDAEPSNLSMRAVSPRPIDTAGAAAAKGTGPKDTGSGDSPTERRSVFRENM